MPSAPNPGYFQFDDIIESLPGIYDAFALSTLGLMERLLEDSDMAGSAASGS